MGAHLRRRLLDQRDRLLPLLFRLILSELLDANCERVRWI